MKACVFGAAVTALVAVHAVRAQAPIATTITYQGQLFKAGVPLDDSADFEFNLYDDPGPSATLMAGAGSGGGDPGGTAGAYLATFVFHASSDADGVFVIELNHDAAGGGQTFLVADFTREITISEVNPAFIHIQAAGSKAKSAR